MKQPPHSQTPLTHAVALAMALIASLAACGGGSATTDTTGTQPTTPAPTSTPATTLTFAGGATITLDNAASQTLIFATSKPTTTQTPVVLASSTASVVPLLQLADNGQYTLRLQVVGSYQGNVTVSAKIGDETFSITAKVDTMLRVSETGSTTEPFGATPKTFTIAQLLALFAEHANVASIDITASGITSTTDPNKVLGSVTQDQDKGTITITPLKSGTGTLTLQIKGLPVMQESAQAVTTSSASTPKKEVTLQLPGITSPTVSLNVSSTLPYISAGEYRGVVVFYACLTLENTSCVPKLSGADAALFEIDTNRNAVIAKGYLPAGTYRFTLESGDVRPTVMVTSQNQSPVDAGGGSTGGGGTECPPGDPTC